MKVSPSPVPPSSRTTASTGLVGDRVVAQHQRDAGKEQVHFDPLHYLALLERKPGALGFAGPLENWGLPECFWTLRRRMGAAIDKDGRISRNGADWYQLLELCGVFDTLLADTDGIYHPCDFNDRLVLGLKGTMSEAELHSLRLRLEAGRVSKAKRGELVQHLPTGSIRMPDGNVAFDPDISVQARPKPDMRPLPCRAFRRNSVKPSPMRERDCRRYGRP